MRHVDIPTITAVDATVSVTDAVLEVSRGNAVVLSSAGGNLPALTLGRTVVLDGWTNPASDGVYTVTEVTTSTEEYRLSKREGPAPVAQAAETINVRLYNAMVKIEAESPQLHVLSNTGGFSFVPFYSLDGISWVTSGITAITALGVTTLTGKRIWVRLNVTVVGAALKVGYAV